MACKSLLAPFFISFLLVAMVLNLPSEVNGFTLGLYCDDGPKLYITAACNMCQQLCGGIPGIVCAECAVNDAEETYCVCVFPRP
ncbi:hypothetical protein MKX03_037923 [Papaver bracteatum]|nr:hypothetical protein MKX03_037923 [Papaver bracteatum]